MDRRAKESLIQRHTDSQHAYENMFIITSQGNTNQTHTDIPSRICEIAHIKKIRNDKYWQGYEKKELLNSVDGRLV